MASFFRNQIARKVLPFLKNKEGICQASPKVISSFIKVNRNSKNNPELLMSWEKIVQCTPKVEDWLTLPKLVNILRNQGLPTAEGVIDIGMSDSPLGLTFTIDKHVFSKIVLSDICEEENPLAADNSFFCNLPQQKVCVHLSLPAVGEKLNITDFRAIIHGNFIENINTFIGNPVNKICTMADWSLKLAILLTGYRQFGNKNELLNDPSNHLLEISEVANQLYKSDSHFQAEVNSCFESEDKSSDWIHLRNLCLEQCTPLFKKLNISFDNVSFDSTFSSEINKIYEDLIAKKLISLQDDGTLKANFISKYKESLSSIQFSKSFVYSLCSAMHSTVKRKATDNFDILYYVAPKSKANFFLMFSSLLKELNYSWSEKLCFVGVENIFDLNGGKKKRLPTEETFDQAKQYMLKTLETDLHLETDESLKTVADVLSYSSLLMFDMRHRRNSPYSLKWSEIMHFGRNSGAAVQLCHAGLKGLLEDNEILFKVDIDTSPLLEPEAQQLILHLSRFDEMMLKSYTTLEPFFLWQYLSTLWYYTDRAANVLKLDLKSDRMIVIKARLLLFSATLNVLRKCLQILGVKPYVNKYSQPKFV